MTSIEDRLRAAMKAAGDTVPDRPPAPLHLPRRAFRFALPGLRGRFLTVAAPLAAATAVAAIIAAAAIAHNDAVSPPAVAGGSAALRILPRYHVALTFVGQFKSWKIRRTEAVVASTVTGRRIATIAPPAPYNAFAAVSGSPDGRTFIVAAEHLVRRFHQWTMVRLYELRVASGEVALRALPVPPLPWTYGDGIALSPDGSEIAYAYNARLATLAGLRVYDVATGKLAHSWPVLPPPPPSKCCVFDPQASSPSWEANGRYLALDVTLAHCSRCVDLIDTQAPGDSVQAVGKVIARTRNRHYPEDWTDTIITPDGNRLIRSAMVGVRVSRHSYYEVPHIFKYSVTSGATTWQRRGSRQAYWTVVWSSSNGRSFVVTTRNQIDPRPTQFITAALFRRGHWVPVPLPAKTVALAW